MYSAETIRQALTMYREGFSAREVAGRLGVHYTTVGKWVREAGVPCRNVREALQVKRRRIIQEAAREGVAGEGS